jgi:hypothetical protein
MVQRYFINCIFLIFNQSGANPPAANFSLTSSRDTPWILHGYYMATIWLLYGYFMEKVCRIAGNPGRNFAYWNS